MKLCTTFIIFEGKMYNFYEFQL